MFKTFLFKEERKFEKLLVHFFQFVLFVINFSPFYFQPTLKKLALFELNHTSNFSDI
jgi:hypothetical protein